MARTRFRLQTDGRTDGQSETNIPPLKLRFAGGIITNPNSTARTVNGPDTHPTLPTLVKADILYKLLEGNNPDIHEYLFNNFTSDFDLGNNSPIFSSCPRNSVSVNFLPQQARRKLHKEIQAGRMAGLFGQPPFDPFHICPIGLRPNKTPGQYRLIHDLSYPYDFSSINYNIPQSAKQVSYSFAGKAIQLIQKLLHGAYAAKTDIENAFKLIPVKPSVYPKLSIFFEDQYYDKTLPQGCASSCRIFETFTTAVQWILKECIPNILCTHYIDDFIFLAESAESCNEYLSAFLKLCSELGIPIAPDKTAVPCLKSNLFRHRFRPYHSPGIIAWWQIAGKYSAFDTYPVYLLNQGRIPWFPAEKAVYLHQLCQVVLSCATFAAALLAFPRLPISSKLRNTWEQTCICDSHFSTHIMVSLFNIIELYLQMK